MRWIQRNPECCRSNKYLSGVNKISLLAMSARFQGILYVMLLMLGILSLGLPAQLSGYSTEMMVPEVLNGNPFCDVGWKLVVRILTDFKIEDHEPKILCQRKFSS